MIRTTHLSVYLCFFLLHDNGFAPPRGADENGEAAELRRCEELQTDLQEVLFGKALIGGGEASALSMNTTTISG